MVNGGSEVDSITVLGVPTSAGSHHAGLERAPSFLRTHGLTERLQEHIAVIDAGDAPVAIYHPMGVGVVCRDLETVTSVVREVALRTTRVADSGSTPLVIGGDCTITLGVVAGLIHRYPNLGLVYVDGDADLSVPDDHGSGVLDTMGMSHLLGHVDNALSRVGGRYPMLREEDVALFGYHPVELAPRHAVWLDSCRAHRFPVTEMRGDPAGAAQRALAELRAHERPILIHFDVDVIDSGDMPIANFPHFNGGLTASDAFKCLGVLLAAPQVTGIVVTEVNPTHDLAGGLLASWVRGFTEAFRGL